MADSASTGKATFGDSVMDGVRVGKRVIGAQAPVTIGWDNIGRVQGGPIKQFVFTWFQPTALFALVAFWYYAPNSIAKASTAIGIGIGFKILLLALEWVNPRYESCLLYTSPSPRDS